MNESRVVAPAHLDAQTRGPFREEALVALSRLDASTRGLLVIDLGGTQRIDSAGLGILVMLQLRASEKKVGVVLRGASEEVRFLLLMTKLADRFTIE